MNSRPVFLQAASSALSTSSLAWGIGARQEFVKWINELS